MTREEITVEMGVGAAGIEHGLGIGNSYVQKWVGQVKGEEEKYTGWWNTELKKREEMEVAASVRAASRSIQARRLLREREMAREAAAGAEQTAANAVIGGGSVPAGWAERAAAVKAGKELEMKAAEALRDTAGGAHGTAGAFRELMVVIREAARGDFKRMFGSVSRLLGMLGLTTTQILGVGAAAAEAGAIIYYALSTRKAVLQEEQSEKNLDTGAGTIAHRLRDEIKNLEKAGKLSKETAEKYDAILQHPTMERNRVIQDQLRKLGGTVSKHDVAEEARLDEEHRKKLSQYAREDMNTSERLTMDLLKVHLLKDSMAKLDRTSLDYKKQQLELDDAQRDVIADQKKLEEEKGEILRKNQEEQNLYDKAKLRISEIQRREHDSYLPTLDELAHHGRFMRQARGVQRLERRIKRDFEMGNTGQAELDITARDKAYDSLADRKVIAERSSLKEIEHTNAEMALHLKNIAEGKKALLVKFGMKT